MAFLAVDTGEREKGEKKRENPNFLSTIQGVPSARIHRAESQSSSTRRGSRVHIYQKGEISPKIQRRRFQKIKDFGLGRLPTRATMIQEVGFLLL